MAALPSLDEQKKINAWINTPEAPGRELSMWRQDVFGYLIYWPAYGDTSSPYGWQIDHIVPLALGGSDHPSNLRALHYRANAGLGGRLSAALMRGNGSR